MEIGQVNWICFVNFVKKPNKTTTTKLMWSALVNQKMKNEKNIEREK